MSEVGTMIAVVCGDAGGASAVAPVIEALQADNTYRVSAFAYRQALDVWARRGLAFEELSEATTAEDTVAILLRTEAKLLLTGTSINGIDLEKKFIVAARALAVPSLALMDFWSNYNQRFADETGKPAYVPDWIAVMDERARGEMTAAGIDPKRLVITGQPAFDEVLHISEQFSPARREGVRSKLTIARDERMILFASQPLSALHRNNPADFKDVGYTEQTVLEALVPALERIAQRTAQKLALVIRPHPRERARELERFASRIVRIVVSAEGDAREVALASDLVAGMTTVLLVEASLMGCAVVSLQPGLNSADVLPNSGCFCESVYQNEFEPVIEHLLLQAHDRTDATARTDAFCFAPGAARRVIQVIDSINSAGSIPDIIGA